MDLFNEDANFLSDDNYVNFIKEVIISTITVKTGSSFSQSIFTKNKIISYICKCGQYPIISFFSEEIIGKKCGCGFEKISIIEYKNNLEYFEKEIKCKEGRNFTCYCFNCNQDICNECKLNEHNNHFIKDYEMINKEENIEELLDDIKFVIRNEIEEKINPYYIDKNKDEIILQNQRIEQNMKFDDLDFYQNCDKNFLEISPYICLISIIFGVIKKYGPNYSHFLNIKNIHLFLEIRKKNRLIIEYKFSGEKEISIFGEKFVENNKNNCEIIFNQKKQELKGKLTLNQEKNNLILVLVENNNVTDMSELFNKCGSLVKISDESYWDTSYVKNMNKMFNYCTNLKKFPKIKGWNTENVESLKNMFNNCSSLEEIEGLSDWKTNNVVNMSGLFSGCRKLKTLPDLSKWETNKVTKMINLFNKCNSLEKIEGIQNWNLSNVEYINGLFCECSKLKSLPDLSKWKTNNITNMKNLFNKCESLEEIEGIQNWNISNVDDINGLFCECCKLKSLPDLSLWEEKTNKIKDMAKIFEECNELESLPDISLWNVSEVYDFSKMFYRCIKLKSLPDLSKWFPKENAEKRQMFSECKDLRYLPNISEWFCEEDNLIDGCSSLQNKPRYNHGRYIF